MLVNTIYDLQNIENNLSGDYALGRDIDASQTATWNLGQGFKPIGTIGDNLLGFDGEFEGNGHAISGLYINRVTSGVEPNGIVGLFSVLNSSARVIDIDILNADITGATAGIVAASSFGQIDEVRTSGTVAADYLGGGIVGQNGIANDLNGSVSAEGIIALSTADVDVRADRAGGIAGLNEGEIKDSSSTGLISNSSVHQYALAGGLVGLNHGLLVETFSLADVVGASDPGPGWGMAGGLVGANYNDVSGISPRIESSYAAGAVSGFVTGGLIGSVACPDPAYAAATLDVRDSYWDTVSTGQQSSAAGTGITTDALTATLPAGFGVDWGLNPQVNHGYPYLLWQRVSATNVTTLTGGPPIVAPPPPPPPLVHTYVMSGTGSVLSAADIAGHSFAFGTFFVDTVTGVRYTPEQLGGTTLPRRHRPRRHPLFTAIRSRESVRSCSWPT